MSDINFQGWRRPAVAQSGTLTPLGRLATTVTVGATVHQLDGGTGTASAAVPLELLGPGDIAGLGANAIRTVMPQPGAVGFEERHSPYIELVPAELPWRYTPVGNEPGGGVRPWLVLVVGTEADGELTVLPSGLVTLSPDLMKLYDLSRSSRWAHMQDDGVSPPLARVLSVRPLEKTPAGQVWKWTAVLVPAFNAAGAPAWPQNPGDPVTLPCYHRWSFSTATDLLDFKTMAAALEPQDPAGLGVVDLSYRAQPGHDLAIRGALTTSDPVPAADGAIAPDIAADLALRRAVGSLPLRPPVLGLPTYGDLWVDPKAPVPTWEAELDDDPRRRGVAGLGAWCAVREQDLLLDSARRKWGAILPVAQRVRSLALGLAASSSLWRRRMPVAPERRLLLYGPSLAGMVAEGDHTVLELLTTASRPFSAAFFSGAARRAMRPSTGRRPHGSTLSEVDLVDAANRCPEAPKPPGGLPDGDGAGRVLAEQGRGDGRSFLDLAREGRLQAEGIDNESLVDIAGRVPGPPRHECQPLDIGALVGVLDAAVDPTSDDAPARTRVLGPIEGLEAPLLAPPEPCADIDVPAWRFLRDHAKRWLLPGAEVLQPDHVTGLSTNPVFVDAFLVGLNQQLVGELRWRNVPVRTGCTPVRRFWDLVHPDAGTAHDDIVGIAAWDAGSSLGEHLPADAPSSEFVVVLRTQLFRRYPDTLIYLVHDPAFSDPPPDPTPALRVLPVLVGEVERDLPFFGFPITPAVADEYWVVIEQVPHGYQFGVDDPVAVDPDGGVYAQVKFISPVRVFLSGAALMGSAP